jgi:hypothetical protein
VEDRFPGLSKACPRWHDEPYYSECSNAFYAIAEDSGIGMIHYTDHGSNARGPGGWYQVLDARQIVETELCYENCTPAD